MNHLSPSLYIITGAYGSGKTECVLALAAEAARTGPVTLLDLDFVTPYFRAQDHRAEMEALGVTVIAPDERVAALDAPAMPPIAREVLWHPSGVTLVDLGGDPAGAVVIGQFAPNLERYDFWAVVNFARPTTATPALAVPLLREIEDATRLRLTGLISNTHFGALTTPDDIADGLAQARALGALLDLPVVLLAFPARIAPPETTLPLLPIVPRLHRPWDG